MKYSHMHLYAKYYHSTAYFCKVIVPIRGVQFSCLTVYNVIPCHLPMLSDRDQYCLSYVTVISLRSVIKKLLTTHLLTGVPRRQPHRRSGLATLPSVGAVL